MKKYNAFIEKIFWLMMIINPFLDAATGIFKTFFEEEDSELLLSPSLIIRFVFLALLAVYVLINKDRKAIFTLIPIAIAAVASVAVEYISGIEFSVFQDASYIARYVYNIVMIFCWYSILPRLGFSKKDLLYKINKVMCWTLIIIGINVVFGQITGTGHYTYADRFGYRGSMGYYYAGNDITAVIMLLFPVSVYAFLSGSNFKNKDRNLYIAAAALSMVTMSLIGTKTSFIALFFTAAVIIVYSIIVLFKEKNALLLKRFAVIVVCALVMAGAIMGLELLFEKSSFLSTISTSIKSTGNIFNKEGLETALLSGRQVKLEEAFTQFKDAGPLAWLFGIGRGSQESIIEMDIPEVLCYYGIFGFVTMLWLYVALGFRFIKNMFRKFSFGALTLFISLTLCVGYLLIAGHILFSVTSGYYFTLMLAYSAIFFSDDIRKLPEEIPFPFRKLLVSKAKSIK